MDSQTMLFVFFGFNREPMNSWIMKRWLETHNEDEYPDLSITQEKDAFHVLPETRHPPEESIKRMCSPGFFSQHKYKYVEGPIDFRLKESFEELENPPASPPYDEPVRDHRQDCVAEVATSNEDLGYACPMNGRIRSMDIENETINPLYKKSTTASGKEHQNLIYAEQNANTNETHHYAEVTEIGYHLGRSHNKNGTHIAAIGFKDKNNEREGSESERCPSLSIHNEKQTDISKETKYQCPRENRGNQVGLNEKGETQSYQSKTELQEQEGDEEDLYGPIAQSEDVGHNENAILVEVNEAMKNALVEDGVNAKYPSLTIHYKKPSGIPKEKENQFLIEHSRNQADLTEKDETQNYQSRKTKLQHEQEENEEVIYDSVIQSSDLEHNENAILEDVGKQEQTVGNNADSVNTKCPSLTIHYKEPTGVPKQPRYQPLTEHCRNQADLTEKDQTQSCQSSQTRLQHKQEESEEVIYDYVIPSSDLEHNANTILEEVRKQEQKAVKNADSVNTKYPSLTIHYKEPTGVPKETENQRPREHTKYQAGMTERDETQGNPPKKRTKIQPEHQDNEGDISDCIPMKPEDEGKNARLGEICNQKQNVSQEENVRVPYPHEDDSGASTEDTPVTQTLCTEKMEEDDHVAQRLQPTGEGTECEVPHQSSPFRRTRVIRRKRKSPETQKQATRKAKNLENKENAASEYGSEKEVVREQVLKEVNEQDRTEEQSLSNEISPCLLQGAGQERHISAWDKEFSEIEMNLDI